MSNRALRVSRIRKIANVAIFPKQTKVNSIKVYGIYGLARGIAQSKRMSGFEKAVCSGQLSPHWLRHAHANHATDRSAPVRLVKETLGHANIATTGRYLHARPIDSSSLYLDFQGYPTEVHKACAHTNPVTTAWYNRREEEAKCRAASQSASYAGCAIIIVSP